MSLGGKYMDLKACKCCEMDLTEEVLGTNLDGTKNEEYCIWCLKEGAFIAPNFTEGDRS